MTLDDAALSAALATVPAWQRRGNAITRTWRFPDFVQAMRFVNRMAELAEEANHHPDIAIHYAEVTLSLWSHDAGGLTERDFRLARRIDEVG